MQEYKRTKDNTYQTSLRLPKELYEKIEKMAIDNERKPAEQIRHMLKKYIEIISNN
jgi:predicted DNA-binding protein